MVAGPGFGVGPYVNRFEQLLVSKEVGKEKGHDQFNRNNTCTESRIIDF